MRHGRRVLSTHLLRRRARAAAAHYRRLQAAGTAEGGLWPPTDEPARQTVYELGINLTTPITVERATHERGKWVVIAST